MAYQIAIENYYEILELPRNASKEDIYSQFKALVTRYHPGRHPTNGQINALRFAQICEAHDVLSNDENKAIYDIYGEYGLKQGCVTPEGGKYLFDRLICDSSYRENRRRLLHENGARALL